jgi:GTPase SAR1 family protein
MDNKPLIHVAMVGAAGSGKTEILRRLQGYPFRAAYHPTGQETITVEFPDYLFVVTEYSGQQYYSPEVFKDVTAYLLVSTERRVDQRYAESFHALMPDNIPFAKIENKSDLSTRAPPPGTFACSAKQFTGVTFAFNDLARQIYGQA